MTTGILPQGIQDYVQGLENTLKTTQGELTSLEKTHETALETIQGLSSEVAFLKSSVRELEDLNANLESNPRETELNSQISSLKSEIASLSRKNAEITDRLDYSSETLKNKSAECEKLSATIKTLKEKNEDLSFSSSSSQSEVKALESELSQKNAEITQLKSTVQNLSEGKDALTQSLQELKADFDELKESNQALFSHVERNSRSASPSSTSSPQFNNDSGADLGGVSLFSELKAATKTDASTQTDNDPVLAENASLKEQISKIRQTASQYLPLLGSALSASALTFLATTLFGGNE